MYIPIFTHPAAPHCVSLCARVCVLYVRSVGYSGRKPLRSEENCWAIVRVTRLVVRGEKGGGKGGRRRPRSKSAEGNRELQSKRDITLSKTGCYAPSLPLPASSSPSFCSLSDQLLLIKILTADLPGSPSSSPPRPPSLALLPTVSLPLFSLL